MLTCKMAIKRFLFYAFMAIADVSKYVGTYNF